MKNIFLGLVLLFSASSFAGGDAKKGEAVFKKVNCALCHNADGLGKAKDGKLALLKGPRIAGLREAYIVEQVTAVQKKTRKTKFTAMMYSKIRKLTAAEIADVAAYVHKLSKDSFKGMNEK